MLVAGNNHGGRLKSDDYQVRRMYAGPLGYGYYLRMGDHILRYSIFLHL